MKLEVDNWVSFILTVLGAFGGWAVVVGVLTHYLADLFAKRTLQREASRFTEQLASLSHELKLRESSYSKHLDLLLDYYSIYYRHYRLCQDATNQDVFRMPDGSIIKTRDVFLERLGQYLQQSEEQEGKVRLLLPAALLTVHGEAIDAFNEFKEAMRRTTYDEKFHDQTRTAFAKVHEVKGRLESGLREFLRTEQLLKVAE